MRNLFIFLLIAVVLGVVIFIVHTNIVQTVGDEAQATRDAEQATRDAEQAARDAEQATRDAELAETLDVALDALGDGDYEQAKSGFKTVLEIDPENETALAGMTTTLFGEGDYETASLWYHHWINVNPQSGYAYMGLGETYEAMGNYDAALENYDKAANLDPDLELDLAQKKGRAFEKLEQYQAAIVEYQRAVEVGKAAGEIELVVEIILKIGEIYYDLEEFEQAEIWIVRAYHLAEEHGLELEQVIYAVEDERVAMIVTAVMEGTATPTWTPSLTATSQPSLTASFTASVTPSLTPRPVILTFTPTETNTKKPKEPKPPTDTPKPPTNTAEPTATEADRCGAVCEDGTITDSTGAGACSYHGGVIEWLYPPDCP